MFHILLISLIILHLLFSWLIKKFPGSKNKNHITVLKRKNTFENVYDLEKLLY
jgi:hypothetical protein